MLQLKINDIDRTGNVDLFSIVKQDNINERTDTLRFSMRKVGSLVFVPEVNQTVELNLNGDKIFGGVITSVDESTSGERTLRYDVTCSDFSFLLNRGVVVEGYENTLVVNLIKDLINTHASDFTDVNVVPDSIQVSTAFNRVPLKNAIQRVADLTNHFWYVDYNKDVHFFPKNKEPAPFGLTDTSGNHIYDSLFISKDISQIRNKVFVRGGEIEGVERIETFDGDDSKTFFRTANKFARRPQVVVSPFNTIEVGIDFLDNEDDFDAFWSFNEKYIRFKIPPASAADSIEITGIPLFNVVVEVEEPVSIGEFGVFEYAKIDRSISSREEAVDMAKAELEAYSQAVNEGSFDTYTNGLRAGQVININSAIRGVNEDFLIQRVSTKPQSSERMIYTVIFASLRTLGIIDFLISLLRQSERVVGTLGEEVVEKTVFPREFAEMSEVISINTDDVPVEENAVASEEFFVQELDFDTEFVVGPYVHDPSDTDDKKRQFVLDCSLLH